MPPGQERVAVDLTKIKRILSQSQSIVTEVMFMYTLLPVLPGGHCQVTAQLFETVQQSDCYQIMVFTGGALRHTWSPLATFQAYQVTISSTLRHTWSPLATLLGMPGHH